MDQFEVLAISGLHGEWSPRRQSESHLIEMLSLPLVSCPLHNPIGIRGAWQATGNGVGTWLGAGVRRGSHAQHVT